MKFKDLKVGMTVLNMKTKKTSKIVRIHNKTEEVCLSNGTVRFWNTYGITWTSIELVKLTEQQENDIEDLLKYNTKDTLLRAHKNQPKSWRYYNSLNDISVEDMEHLLEYGYEVIDDPQNEVEMIEAEIVESELKYSDLKVGMHVQYFRYGKLHIEGEIVQLKDSNEMVVVQLMNGRTRNIHFSGTGRTWKLMPLRESDLNGEHLELLHEIYVDMALATNDTEWFNTLVRGRQNA